MKNKPQMQSNSLMRSFWCAGVGLAHVVRTQRNARIDLVIGLLAIILAFLLHLSSVEWAVLFVVIGLVLSAEAFNTVAEVVVDLATGGEYSEEARIAKDAAAGAVLMTAIVALLVGVFLFIPHIISLFTK
ncbi:MAG: diacylglycerol kinase family protein [Chloroflexi bacterium]|nr:diacylglycerol kinase family protein [Chloroflexota bacterium]